MSRPSVESSALSHTDPVRPRRRGFRFGLLSFLLFVLWAASGVMTWLYREPWVLAGTYPKAAGGICFSSDSAQAMIGDGVGGLQIVSTRTGAVLGSAPADIKHCYNWRLSPNWDWIASYFMKVEETPAHLDIFDCRTGKRALKLDLDWMQMFHFSGDGQRLLVSNYWGINAYRFDSDQPLWALPALYPFTPASSDDEQARPPEEVRQVRAYERALREARTLKDLQAAVNGLDLLQHQARLSVTLAGAADMAVTELYTSEGRFAFGWDLSTGTRVSEFEGLSPSEDDAIVCSNDGNYVASFNRATGELTAWDWSTGRVQASSKVPGAPFEDGGLQSYLGSGMFHGSVADHSFLWDSVQNRRLAAGAATIWGLTPDGSRAVATSDDRKNIFWIDTATGARVFEAPAPENSCSFGVSMSPDGRHMAASGHMPWQGDLWLFTRRHGEGPYGVLDMPISWAFMALTLVQFARLVQWRRRRQAHAIPAGTPSGALPA